MISIFTNNNFVLAVERSGFKENRTAFPIKNSRLAELRMKITGNVFVVFFTSCQANSLQQNHIINTCIYIYIYIYTCI